MLSGNSQDIDNKSDDLDPKHYSSVGRILSILLAIGGTAAMTILFTFFLFFPGTGAIPFIIFIPLTTTIVDSVYHFTKVWLNPSIPLSTKIPVLSLMLVSFLSATVSMATGILAGLGVSAFATLAPFNSILFTISLAIGGLLSAWGLFNSLREFYSHPWTRSHLAKLDLINKTVKTVALLTLSAITIPFFLSMGSVVITAALANPFTAGPVAIILFSISIAAVTALVVMKIIKTLYQHRLQEILARQAVEEKNFDPYAVLGLERADFALKSNREIFQLVKNRYTEKQTQAMGEKEPETETLQNLHRAYEILSNPRTRDLYHAFTAIKKGGISSDSIKALVGDAISPANLPPFLSPFLWVTYTIQSIALRKNEKERNNLKTAYLVLSNRRLYAYYLENNYAAHNQWWHALLPKPTEKGEKPSHSTVSNKKDNFVRVKDNREITTDPSRKKNSTNNDSSPPWSRRNKNLPG